ncbi:transposase [Moritella marina ATCC 15381]|uniref:Transposase n=1 Tax=Moritella marina ATCC 15381 TaxID=1202962 RepID=A0A5J6WNN5_MORMI|nr:helix-turn-helix domain-containing protein [Moritella marina]QFI39292.1 transposase [Moritella marina ATCC 15381]QFI39766.1 transposase [Moritella marina ATCC 15381]
MSKYSREFKLITAQQCLDGKSSRILANELSIPSQLIRYWTQVFAIHGTDAFLPNLHASNAKTKLQALKLMWTNEWSLNHTSAILNQSSPGTLSVWLKKYNEFGLRGLERSSISRLKMKQSNTTTKPDSEMTTEELKEELAYLRAENAVLKKLEELEQAKRRQTKKKR